MTQHNIRALQVFECVYRHKSIKKAADELSVTPSAISHKLRQLREEIGEHLIGSNKGHLTFTDRGIKLAGSLSNAFAEIDRAVQRSVCDGARGLRVATCTAFGSGWLIRRLAEYPNLSRANIQLKLHAYQPDLGDAVADIFFTTTPIRDGYHSVRLMSEDLVAVISPTANRTFGASPPLITTELEEHSFAEDWVRYSELNSYEHSLSERIFVGASHYLFALLMAQNSMGVALVPEFLAEGSLALGTVMLWSTQKMWSGKDYFMNYKYTRRSEEAIRDFAQWVRKNTSKSFKQSRDYSSS